MNGPVSKRELLDAARTAIDSEAQKREQRREAERVAAAANPRPWLAPLVGGASLVLAALLLIRPAFLFGGAELPPETPVVQAANTRATLGILAARLQAYRKKSGALPRTLNDLGAGLPNDVSYERIDDTRFMLRTTTTPVLTFGSEDDPSVLLKDQFSRLRGRVK
jgi:hypothetical protein